MQNEAVDIIAHDGTTRYSTPRIRVPNGAASTQVVSPPPDHEPLCSPSSKKMVAGVWANEKTACAPGSAGPCLTDQFDALGRSVDNAAGRSAAEMGRHREMLDHKQRAPCHQQDNLFDCETYERSKPATFLGSSKKRPDGAEARMIGAAPALLLVPEAAVGKIFHSKGQSAGRPADHLTGAAAHCSEPTVAATEDPFMVTRPSASNGSADGTPQRFVASVTTGPSIPGSRLGRGVYTPANHGNLIAHDPIAQASVGQRIHSGMGRPASPPLSATLERPQTSSARFSHTPQDRDIFAVTGLRSVATPLPAADPLFCSKRRDGPFTPRDSLRPNGQFS